MSVDIKELRIGNHIVANDVKCSITDLEMYRWRDGKERPHGCFRGMVKGEWRTCGSFLDVEQVQPIPITEELLTELGFEKKIAKHKDNTPYYFLEFDEDEDGWGNTVFVEKHSGRDLWRVEICDKTMNCGNIRIQWLHELENFYYHVFKKELIEE